MICDGPVRQGKRPTSSSSVGDRQVGYAQRVYLRLKATHLLRALLRACPEIQGSLALERLA